MSILSRFSDIVSANINALLDKAEDPSKMIDQYLRNAMDDLAEVKKETASVMAETKRCKRLVDSAQEDVDKYNNLARKALAAGSEDDARTFIAKKQEATTRLEGAKPAYEAALANEQKMRQLHDKLQSDIEALQARRNNIKATVSVAKTQEKVNKITSSTSSASGAISAFERMEDKANAMLDRSNAAAELAEDARSDVDDLEKKYSSGGSVSVDDELAKLKSEMGL